MSQLKSVDVNHPQAAAFSEANLHSSEAHTASPSARFTSTRLNNGAKQRILGAVVLAALGVLFLPVLLQRPDMPTVDTRSQIPDMPESLAAARPQVTVVPAPPPKPMPDDVFAVEPIAPAVTNPSTVVVGRSQSASDAGSAGSVSQSVPPTSSPSATAPQGWVIQVASYATEASAQRLVNRLLQKAFRAYFKPVTSAGKSRYRVYVGPYLQKDTAKQVQTDINQQFNVQSLLYRHQ